MEEKGKGGEVKERREGPCPQIFWPRTAQSSPTLESLGTKCIWSHPIQPLQLAAILLGTVGQCQIGTRVRFVTIFLYKCMSLYTI